MKESVLPKIVFIDQDECLVSGGWLYLLNEFLGTHYVMSDFSSYFIEEEAIQDPMLRKEFYQYLLNKNIYRYVEYLPGALAAMEKLCRSSLYRPYILTSYSIPQVYESCGILAAQKHDFFVRTMPFLPRGRLLLTSGDKMIFRGDIRIDDLVKNLENADQKILMTSFHNEKVPIQTLEEQGIIRVKDWYEVEKVLKLK